MDSGPAPKGASRNDGVDVISVKQKASQLAGAPGAVRGESFFRLRIKLAGPRVPFNSGVEPLRVEGLEPYAKPRGASCSTALSMSSVVISEI
jgi:hypothetical protein